MVLTVDEVMAPDKLILGCGYVGTAAALRWLETGQRVRSVVRRPERVAELRRLGIDPLVANVLDPATLTLLPAAPTILYCVSHPRQAAESRRATYVTGLENVLDALANARTGAERPPLFLYVSSTSVYGQTDGSWVTEESPTHPTSEAGQIMLEAEELLWKAHAAGKVRGVVLRLAGIYGPGRLFGLATLQSGQPLPGDPGRWLNLIHRDDAVAALLAAVTRARPGESYNVADGAPPTRGEYYAFLAHLAGLPPPAFDPDAAATGLATYRGEGNRRVANTRLLHDLGVTLRFPTFKVGLADALLSPAPVEAPLP